MKTNAFWNLASRGGTVPDFFDYRAWKQAWDHAIRGLKQRIDTFSQTPSWDTYYTMGQGIVRIQTLIQTMTYTPLFLQGMPESERQEAHRHAVTEFETLMNKTRDAAETFLRERSYKGQHHEQIKARREHVYWTGFSPKRAECLKIEQTLHRDGRPLHFSQLAGLNDMPDMKRKLRRKAQTLGLTGYAIDSTDAYVDVVWKTEPSEERRELIWKKTQEGPVTTDEIASLLNARKAWAEDAGTRNYMDYLDRLNPGLSFYSVEKALVQSIKRCAPAFTALKNMTLEKGSRQTGFTPTNDSHATLPWNEGYLMWEGGDPTPTLSGKEFPLERVLNVIVPDLLAMGGWQVIGAPTRIGRGKRCLYLYRMQKNNKMAMLYFAPYPGQDVRDSDSCQAYASMIRERWTGGTETTPIVLVAQNFSLTNGYLSDLDQLAYLCHEMGHAMHFLSLKGNTFDEYSRLHNHVVELPSILFEQLVKDPVLLQKWCSPKYAPGRKVDYWTKRLPRTNILYHVDNNERAYLDLLVHRTHDNDLVDHHHRLRKTVGLPSPHVMDKTALNLFDRSEVAGLFCTYGIAEALTKKLIPGTITANKIKYQMELLLNDVLTKDADLTHTWKRTYGESLYDMYNKGVEQLDQELIQLAKKEVRHYRKKMGPVA